MVEEIHITNFLRLILASIAYRILYTLRSLPNYSLTRLHIETQVLGCKL